MYPSTPLFSNCFSLLYYENQDDPRHPFWCGRQKIDNKINYGLSSADKNSIINNYGQIQKILHYNLNQSCLLAKVSAPPDFTNLSKVQP